MAWIKRNKFFVIIMVVGLACIAYCSVLFFGNSAEASKKDIEFTSDSAQYKSMMSSPVFPSEENTAGAKEDIARTQDLLTKYQKAFVSFPPPPKMDQQDFKAYLAQTVYDLGIAATNAGVTLPDQYSFGFTSQQKDLNYAPENIQPWLEQLAEIKVIFGILYQARINAVEMFQRIHVSTKDDGPSSDFVEAQKVTNAPLVSTPYKLTFRSFGRELANVLSGFAQSSNCFIVKTIQVERGYVPDTQNFVEQTVVSAPPTAAFPLMQDQGGEADPRRSYRDRRAAQPQPQGEAATPAVRRVPKTVLAEGPLRITLSIEAVQILPPAPVQTNSVNPAQNNGANPAQMNRRAAPPTTPPTGGNQ